MTMPRLPHQKYAMLNYRLCEHMKIVRKIEAELNAILKRVRPAECRESDWELAIFDTVNNDESVRKVGVFPHTLKDAMLEIAENGGEVTK